MQTLNVTSVEDPLNGMTENTNIIPAISSEKPYVMIVILNSLKYTKVKDHIMPAKPPEPEENKI
jgi:hypothetical protein